MEFCRLTNRKCENASPFGGCFSAKECKHDTNTVDFEDDCTQKLSVKRDEAELEHLTAYKSYLMDNKITNNYVKHALQVRQIELLNSLINVTKMKLEKI